MKQLRQKFGPMRKALERGKEFLLMYRSKPLAVIRPYSAISDAQHLTGQANNGTSTTQPTNNKPTDSQAASVQPVTRQLPNLDKLPDPKTISFSSKFDAKAAMPSLKSSLKTPPKPSFGLTRKPALPMTNKPLIKPLDKLGLKKAFI